MASIIPGEGEVTVTEGHDPSGSIIENVLSRAGDPQKVVFKEAGKVTGTVRKNEVTGSVPLAGYEIGQVQAKLRTGKSRDTRRKEGTVKRGKITKPQMAPDPDQKTNGDGMSKKLLALIAGIVAVVVFYG